MEIRPHRRQCRQRGNTMVETAITMVLYLMLIFGIVGFGEAMWAYTWTGHAAREGSRWASVRGSQSSSPAAALDVKNYVLGNMMGLNSAKANVVTNWPNGNSPGQEVDVTVTYSMNTHAPFVGTINLSSTSKMTVAQ
jgi:Flp pilus assembly protein TadG